MNPTPEQIKTARSNAGLSQQASADLCHVSIKTWQHWEYGKRKMHPGFYELFRIKSGLDETFGNITEFLDNWT